MKLPRVTLRDLFWLVLVVALAGGWWVDRQRLSRELSHLQYWILYTIEPIEPANLKMPEDTPLSSLPPPRPAP